MDLVKRIQLQKVLGAISHMELVEKPATNGVYMEFELDPVRMPGDLGVPPLSYKKAADLINNYLVVPEMGKTGAVDVTLGLGESKIALKFNGDPAEEARDAWPSITAAIQNLRSQHLLN